MDVRTIFYYFNSEGDKMVLKAEYSQRLKEFKHAQKEKRVKSYVAERERIVHGRTSVSSAK